MEAMTITDIVIFLVFTIALMAFSLSPAIWISEKLSSQSIFLEKYSSQMTIFITLFFSLFGAYFIFFF